MQKIAAALLKARKEFDPVIKNKKNPHLRSMYADLEACLAAVSSACLDNGIFLYQETSESPNGVIIETVFLHESGEALRCGRLHVPATKLDAQGYGSALTYARRYSLMTACGLAAEDDDGQDASKTRFTSGAKSIFDELPPDWQAWIIDFAPRVENTFTQLGPKAAQDLINDQNLDNETIAGLHSKLGSKTRSALKALATEGAK